MEGAEGYRDDLRVFCCTSHENGAKEVFGLWSIYDTNDSTLGKELGGSLRRIPDARFAVACSGDALRIANDFSAALQ